MTKTVEELEKENGALKAALDAANKRPAGALNEEQEKIVREKIAAGLTREQAMEVLRSQEAWDAEQAKQKGKK